MMASRVGWPAESLKAAAAASSTSRTRALKVLRLTAKGPICQAASMCLWP